MDNNLGPGGFYGNEYLIRLRLFQFLPTAREVKGSQRLVSFCSQMASWLLDHCSSLLWCGRYASYWNAFFFIHSFTILAQIQDYLGLIPVPIE